MLTVFKSIFANAPDRYVTFNFRSLPEAINPNDMEALFGDLPRLANPQGIDDTDKIRETIVKAYPLSDDFPNQTHNRRSLYMAIHSLRQGHAGWILDPKATKLPAKSLN